MRQPRLVLRALAPSLSLSSSVIEREGKDHAWRQLLLVASLALVVLAGVACEPAKASPAGTPLSESAPAASASAAPVEAAQVPSAPLLRVSLPTPPDADLARLAIALKRVEGGGTVPRTARVTEPPQVGQPDQFWLVDLDARRVSRISASLRLVSLNAFWYVEDGVGVREEDLQEAARAFEGSIFPTVKGIFAGSAGQLPTERLTVLHARLEGAAGYFSGIDRYPREVHRYSNERPMIYMNTRAFRVGSRPYQAVLAHELQHAFHFDADQGEDTWVNEGLSELAAEAAGFPSELVERFIVHPETPLTEWPLEPRKSAPNYGAAHLFFRYLFGHYGGLQEARALVGQPADSMAGVEAYLAQKGYQATFTDVFQEWLVANLLGQQGTGSSQYNNPPPRVQPRQTLKGLARLDGEVPQFGADYVEVIPREGVAVLRFHGAERASLLPVRPLSGDFCWWGNRGDSIQPSMTRPLDLRDLAKATLRFQVWFDIEEDWDYAYVQVSADGGKTWDVLKGGHASPENPVGNSFGPGYTGRSDGWVQEEIDLSPYAGRQVLLRFQYVTDEAVNSHGLCLDDIAVPELGFFDNAEADTGWQADGFFRTDLLLPQLYAVQVVEFTQDGQVTVRKMPLDARNAGELRLEGFGTRLGRVVVIVAPMTAPTRVPAPYTLVLEAS